MDKVAKASAVIPMMRFTFDPYARHITDHGFHFKVGLRLESEWIGETKTLPYMIQLTQILNAFPPAMGVTHNYFARSETLIAMVEHALDNLYDANVINQFEMDVLRKVFTGIKEKLNVPKAIASGE